MGVLYVLNVYGSLFERRHAYLYAPASDDLFYLSMSPTLPQNAKWRVFSPFYKVRYFEPDGGEHLGKLAALLEKKAQDQRLLELDRESWLENQSERFSIEEFDVWDFKYVIKRSEPFSKKVSGKLAKVIRGADAEKSRMWLVDAVAFRHVINIDQPDEKKDRTMLVLNSSLLIEGHAADLIYNADLWL
jgi:hypothetical protein